MEIQQLFHAILEPIHTKMSVGSVFGEPIPAQNKTIIPVAKVGFGYGGGAGEGDQKGENGGGGGGGGMIMPIGAIEITSGSTRFIDFEAPKKLFGVMLAGMVLGYMLAKRLR